MNGVNVHSDTHSAFRIAPHIYRPTTAKADRIESDPEVGMDGHRIHPIEDRSG